MIEDLAPVCPRSVAAGKPHRHAPDLPCWSGRYAQRIRAHVLHTQGRVCWICGERATSADHVTPRAAWGRDTDDNLRPSCMPCQSSRGRRLNPFTPDPEPRPTGVGLSPRWRTP